MEIKNTSIIDNNDSLYTGFNELDNLIGPLNAGLYVVGSRPGMGKTALLLNITANLMANDNFKGKIVYVSTNDSKQINLERLTSLITKIPIRVIQNDEIISDEQLKLMDEHLILKMVNSNQLNIITFNGQPKIDKISSIIQQSKSPISILIIDCLQDFIKENESSFEIQIEDIMESLKVLASEQNIPIIISASIERRVEQRSNKMPTSNDLIGNVEKYADVLLFLLRPEYYQIFDKNEKTYANISVTKNNFGSTGEIELATEMDKLLFKNK
jgi:replicative DNA helicase